MPALSKIRHSVLAGLALAAIAGAAAAKDYVVVASTEPAVPRGLMVDAGVRLTVAPGRSVTLMHASGDVLRLKGAAGGVLAPARKAAGLDAARLEMLRTMVSPSTRTVATGAGQRRSRSGICPSADVLTSLDAVAQAAQAGCADAASAAFESWLAAQPVADEE